MADKESSAVGGFQAKMSFHTGNVSEQWRVFKRQLNFYFDSKIAEDKQTDRKCTGILMTALGREGIEVYDTLFFEHETPTFAQIITAFDSYCTPRKNTVFERSVYFRLRQKPGQSIDAFILELKKQSAVCEFDEEERENLIRDILVIGIRDAKLREELLRDPDLDLTKATQACKARERSQAEATQMEATSTNEPLAIAQLHKTPGQSQTPAAQSHTQPPPVPPPCPACSFRHGTLRPCPALKGACNKCGQTGHFSRMCRTKSAPKEVKAVDTNPPPEPVESAAVDLLRIYECRSIAADTESGDNERAWYAELRFGQSYCKFKLDSAADCNTLSETSYYALSPRPALVSTAVVIKPYNAPPFRPIGKVRLQYQSHMLEFFVMPAAAENLLGFKDCRRLKLLQRVSVIQTKLTYQSFVDTYGDIFQGEGEIPGEHRLYVDASVSPKVARPRRFAYALVDKIKRTLREMESQKVIERITEPTPWVSNVTIVEKPDGTLRVCLDPQNLNKALQIPKYAIPKADDILVQLARKKFFTVLDLRSGFWHMRLDEESSKLTTFNSPLGRFRFTRLCFGVNCAPEMFMAEMVKIFGDIENVSPYFDDLMIATETEEQHDLALHAVAQRARAYNIKFNVAKLQFKSPKVQYLGLLISGSAIQPAPKHIRAVVDMPTPQDKAAVLRFLGLIKFLARFIPNVSNLTAHLRNLTRKDVEFLWTADHEREFAHLKQLIVTKPVLAFFDPLLPLVIQTDSSKDGLGSVLLQNDMPVAYASRALTPAEVKYSQIEKELLAIVFAVERFHEFTYGRPVLVQSDHRPLEAILNKDLDKVSARLQRLRLRLLKYNLQVNYTPGRFMYVADALSRAYLPDEEPCLDYQSIIVHAVAALAISVEKQQAFAEATAVDADLSTVKTWLMTNEWPVAKSLTSPNLVRFAAMQSSLTLQDGLIFHDNRLVVPVSLRQFVLEKLHEGHMGVEKTKRLARDAVFWHGLTADITRFVLSCETCQKFARNNVKEPLKPYPLPSYPWQQLSVDIATHNLVDVLVVVDRYSNWPEVILLRNKSASEVVHHLQVLFGRYGIPEVIVSDNNPFNSAVYHDFAADWGFQPVFTSPHYPQSNGHAERAVQTVKNLLKKCADEKSNFQYALLQYRNTPLADTGYSPAQALMGRRLRTKLPVHSSVLAPQVVPPAVILAQKERSRDVQKYYFDRAAESLPDLTPSQEVWVKDSLTDTQWQPATITAEGPSPRSFVVQKENEGGTVVRNRRFLRPRGELAKPARFRD